MCLVDEFWSKGDLVSKLWWGELNEQPLAVHVKLHIYDPYTYESEHIHREREMA